MPSLLPVALLLAPAPQAEAPPAGLHYRIERASDPQPHVLVHLRLAGSTEGSTELAVRPHWGGVERGGADIGELRVSDDAGLRMDVERRAEHRWRVEHAPGAILVVSYRMDANDHQLDPDPSVHRRPIVTDSLFHAIGEHFLVVPSHVDGRTLAEHSIEWIGFGEDAACSFGVGAGPLRFESSFDALRHAVFLGGAVELCRRDVRGFPVWLACHADGLGFDIEELADLLATVVETERAFFDDFEVPFYLVSAIPVGRPQPDSLSFGGTALTDSFSLALQAGMGLGPGGPGQPDIARLLTHEYFHEWNGLVLGREDPEELVYWFSEGFTDFFARRLMLRAGLIGRADYVESLNDGLRRFYTSPAHDAPNERIREAFWSDPAVGDLPYRRGDVVAMMLDHALRTHTGGERSLDDWMRALVERGRAGWKIGTEPFLALVTEQLSGEFAAALRAILVDGGSPRLADDLFAPCLRLEHHELPTFDMGFDVEASLQAGSARGVRTDGPAHRAGLRDGQALHGWSFRKGEVDFPVVLQIEEAGARRDLRYDPQGPVVSVPRFELVEGASEQDCGCL